MLTIELALRLRTAGLAWVPRPGDRFAVPHRGMDEDVFVISDMTVDVHQFPGGRVIGFNGTTEWAMDSLAEDEVVWLPREDQLRDRLSTAFVRLEARPGGYVVVARANGRDEEHADPDPERAYAHCLLACLGG